ncbi:MAG: PQQ-binding-like beta-propeller repeat protein [Verrucomicrobiota bacterium]
MASASAAADWPAFRGPNADGIAPGARAPLKWSANEGVVWKTDLPGPGASTPIVSRGNIFVTSYTGYGLTKETPGEMSQLKRVLVCLDAANGKVRWTREVKQEQQVEAFQGPYVTLHGYASSSVAADGERVVCFFGNSGVWAFNYQGEKLWSVNVGNGTNEWGAGASPVFYKNLVIINASMESDPLLALDKTNGKVVWRVTKGFPRAWNTPALVDAGKGKPELVVSTNGRLRAFDPDTGKELWFCQGIRAAELCPSIVAHQGIIYVLGHPSGQAMAVRTGGQGDVTQTHVLWRLEKGSNVTSPVFHNGHLYWVSDSKGIVYCLKGESGEVVYEERLAPKPDRFFASPVLIEGRLYYVSRGRGAYVVAAKPSFELLAHNILAPPDEIFNGSPVPLDGKLLLRSDKALYCIGGK